MQYVGSVGQIEVRVDADDDGQVVVVSWRAGTAGGMGLVNVLAGDGAVNLTAHGQEVVARVRHTDEVDRRLVELSDVCASVRYAYPRVMQLKLRLNTQEEARLLEAMDGW